MKGGTLDDVMDRVRHNLKHRNVFSSRLSVSEADLTALLAGIEGGSDRSDEAEAVIVGLWAIRPENWEDDDDPEQVFAWERAQRFLRK